MPKLHILFLDWRLSVNKTGNALSKELNCSVFDVVKALKAQLRNKDDVSKEMMEFVNHGKILSTEVLGKFISKNLKTINGDILLTQYPKTVEQYQGLIKVLKNLNIELESIWYVKQREPDQFRKEHFKNPKEKAWIDKYGSEIIDKWKTELKKRREHILEIQKASSDILKWNIIEVD